ncbi:uncharacterized protein RHOBADRAFT_43561 [Rhodotorula graminis WP1]|uniref:TEA domain-containing protein n=1 Tax=Rhodotorula graminis (strain WP1) TaxID=578459 RepID=A0A194S6A6_RHOGW|nr:uncharacterized protein RHOBADRAFT_43561 [Rhodotorula graminis WP1]KPV76122.1 hypothetical protein RHOBADRAFT_43561 [Rhodotorula graminis WP1]
MKPFGVPHSPPSPRSTPPRATHLSIHPPPPTAPLPDTSASPRRSSPNSHQSASLVVTSPLPRDTPIPSRPTPAALDEPELSSELSELSDSGASDDGVVDDQPPSGTEGASTTVSRPRPVNRGGAKPSVWKDHVAAAFDQGLKLIPDIGKQHVLLNGRRAQRNDLLCEYVRRQTGERRTHQQARNRISTVRARYPHDDKLEQLLVGRPVSQAAIDLMDWDALLGPDQFPNVAPVLSDLDSTKAPGKKRRRASATTTSSKRRKAVPASTPADGRRAKGPSTSGSTPSHKQLFDPFASSGPPPPSRRPPPPPPPAPWVEPLPVRPLPPPSAALPSRPLPDTTYHPFVSNLARVFSSYEPARDHTTTARVLVGLGVDSWDALADLCAFEPSTVERLYEHLRKEVGLGALEVAWVKKAVSAARGGFARGV